jgi:6-phosphogluconolactonase
MHLRTLLMLSLISLGSTAQNMHLFVGTYTNSGSKGIYVYRFNAATGKATLLSNTDSVVNPSFLAISPNHKFVYAVSETNGKNPGKVSAFAFNKNTGRLRFINQQLTGGDDPCYVNVHRSNNWVLVGNYSGGSASVFRANADGSLKPYSQLMQDSGKGVNSSRQEKAHVHSTIFSPDQDYVFTPDLGLDKVMIYKFDPLSNKPLKSAIPSFVQTKPGSGPRHLTFHPNKCFAYLIEELTGTVSAFKYTHGKLTAIQTIAAHPADFKGDIGSADIHVSPDGKFLYASNRGDENTIAIFSLSQTTGRLQLKGIQPTNGKTPRNFIIDPTGKYLLAANQGTNNIVVFKRNQQTGLLTATGEQIEVPMPVCLQLIQ